MKIKKKTTWPGWPYLALPTFKRPRHFSFAKNHVQKLATRLYTSRREVKIVFENCSYPQKMEDPFYLFSSREYILYPRHNAL